MLTLLEDVLDAAERARLRAACDAAGWLARDVADRLHLDVAATAADAPLFARLVDLAAAATANAAATAAGAARPSLRNFEWQRLRHGDYQLLKHDAHTRPPAAHVELIADFSAAATGEAEVFYTDGAATLFPVPQLPGSVAVVARPPSLLRYQRYLSLRVGPAAVHRLRLTLTY